MGRRHSFAEADSTQKYVALSDWRIEEIKKGITEADRGDFASDKDVEQTAKKWTR
jgi:RHH-type rel operon transcriptional repressor/antitoxin RelB